MSDLEVAIKFEEYGFTNMLRGAKLRAVARDYGISEYEAWLKIEEGQRLISNLITVCSRSSQSHEVDFTRRMQVA